MAQRPVSGRLPATFPITCDGDQPHRRQPSACNQPLAKTNALSTAFADEKISLELSRTAGCSYVKRDDCVRHAPTCRLRIPIRQIAVDRYVRISLTDGEAGDCRRRRPAHHLPGAGTILNHYTR